MTGPAIRPGKISDAHALARRVRLADRQEIAASSGASPLKSLLTGVRQSAECRALDVDGVQALFGVVETAPGVGFPWLVGSDAIFGRAKWVFARASKAEIDRFQIRWPVLAGWVHAANAAHVRWLQWCGFRVYPAEPKGGAMFCRFERYV